MAHKLRLHNEEGAVFKLNRALEFPQSSLDQVKWVFLLSKELEQGKQAVDSVVVELPTH